MTAGEIRRRFLILRALRWLPTGLTMPVLVLLLLDRGLTVGQIGLVMAAQGIVVMLLELPTGGLADTLGRRVVLLAAAGFDLASLSLLVVADTLPLLVGVFALQGIYRALESGPLDAWYVDAAQAVDPDADIEGAMAASGVVLGVALAVGTVAGSGLVVLDPIPALNPLVVPLLVAMILRAVELVSIWQLMVEPGRPRATQVVRGLPAVVRESLRMVRGSHALMALIAVELLWGAGMIAFETFTPLRLEAVLGDTDAAAALLGPTSAIAWLVSAGAAAAAPWLARRAGARLAGAAMRVAQGITVAGIGLFAGPAGVIVAYVATMAIHGAANPIHQGLLHRAVTDPHRRATVLSANSLTGHLGGAVGAIGLGFLAEATSLTISMLTAAALLAVAAPLYLIARQPPPPDRGTSIVQPRATTAATHHAPRVEWAGRAFDPEAYNAVVW